MILVVFTIFICSFTDFMGVLTGVGAEKEYERDGVVTKMIVIELEADR